MRFLLRIIIGTSNLGVYVVYWVHGVHGTWCLARSAPLVLWSLVEFALFDSLPLYSRYSWYSRYSFSMVEHFHRRGSSRALDTVLQMFGNFFGVSLCYMVRYF